MRYFYLVTFLFFTIIVLSSSPAKSSSDDKHVVRVGLVSKNTAGGVVLASDNSELKIERSKTNKLLLSIPKNSNRTVKAAGDKLIISNGSQAPIAVTENIIVRNQESDNHFELKFNDGEIRKYFGNLEVTVVNNSLSLINVVDVESYLRSVVANEMQANAPTAALQAQAICSRSYAYKGVNRHNTSGYDLCDTSHCQLYTGITSHNSAVDKAVSATNGTVITYNNNVATVMYSADAGGVTQDYSEIVGKDTYPYLKAVTDPPGIARVNWTAQFRLKELSQKLVAAGVREAKDLIALEIAKQGTGGRVLSLSVVNLYGITTISADKLRTALGTTKIKSTLFTIETSQPDFVNFVGNGFGHGMGLCQTGAMGLASSPFNFTSEKIISHYFPGTVLKSIDSVHTAKTGKHTK